MNIEVGQTINDGDNNLIICSIGEYKNFCYIYVLNEETDEVGFYKVVLQNDIYNFELVEEEKQIEELILFFAKDYAKQNPNIINDIKENLYLENEKEN